jgi:hypothetical protein
VSTFASLPDLFYKNLQLEVLVLGVCIYRHHNLKLDEKLSDANPSTNDVPLACVDNTGPWSMYFTGIII